MSLKAVHLIFVNALTALALGTVVWKVRDYLSPEGTRTDLLFAVAGLAGAILVILYGVYFLRKLKKLSYL